MTENDLGDRHDDAAVLTLLRGVLDDVVRDATRPAPRWDEVERRLRDVRRRRRLRDAGRGAALAGVAAAVVLGAMVVPRPDAAPRPVTSASGTRGSLGGDAAWLAGLRDRVAAMPDSGPARDQKVLFAGDVGPYRVALVDVPAEPQEPPASTGSSGSVPSGSVSFPRTPAGVHTMAWFLGPAGAPPDRMQPKRGLCLGGSTACGTQFVPAHPPDVESLVLDAPDLDADAVPGAQRGDRAVVVVVPLRPTTVTLRGPATYARDGSVGRPAAVPVPESYGAYQAVITDGGRHWLRIGDGEPEGVWGDMLDAPHFSTDGVTPALHGAGTPPGYQVQGAIFAVQAVSGLPIRGSQRRLLWAGTVGDRRSGVVAVTAASGAHVVGVFRQLGSPADQGTWLTATAVLPAGPLEDVAVAWQVPRSRPQEDDDPEPSGRIAVLGPVGATSATFLDGHGRSLTSTTLTDGFGTATAPSTRSVRFTDSTGRALTTTTVRPLLGLFDDLTLDH